MKVTGSLGTILKAVRTDDLVITPEFNRFLMSGEFDKALRPEVAEYVFRQLVTQPRVRSGSFSASSGGFCERRQVLNFLGTDVPYNTLDPRLANIFSDGKWRHLRWQAMLMQIDKWDFQPEFPLDWPKMRHVGSADGALIVPDSHTRWGGAEGGFELKGMNPNLWRKHNNEDWKIEHKRQVARYFLMSGWDIFVTIYENKATNEWYEWVEEPDKAIMREQREELLRLNEAVDDEQIPDKLLQCEKEFGPIFGDCPYGGMKGGKSPCHMARSWPRIKKAA